MVDASVGGKTGIDLDGFKNQVGVFSEPVAVYCDPLFLESLPKRQLISGFAEVLKHGLIKDKAYWDYCSQEPMKNLDWTKVIDESVEIKNNIVLGDPTEKAERKLLNFGHTIGHALETYHLNNGNPITHGEAIAAGMICECFLSTKSAKLSDIELDVISKRIYPMYRSVSVNENMFEDLIGLMKQDKKNDSDAINFTMLDAIGKGIFNQTADESLILESLKYYASLS